VGFVVVAQEMDYIAANSIGLLEHNAGLHCMARRIANIAKLPELLRKP
jgi:hypothetical protein